MKIINDTQKYDKSNVNRNKLVTSESQEFTVVAWNASVSCKSAYQRV